jgi:hypothetical protein
VHVSHRLLGAAVAAALVTGTAGAQTSRPTFGISGGLALPTGDLNKGYKSGYDIAANVGFHPTGQSFGVRVEGAFNQFALKGTNTSNAHTNIFDVTGNIVVGTAAAPGTIRPYLIGGVGVYNVKNEASVGNVSVSTSATKFGFNGGAGLDLPLSGIAAFVEARFHYVLTGSGSSDSNIGYNASFVPIVVGVRF